MAGTAAAKAPAKAAPAKAPARRTAAAAPTEPVEVLSRVYAAKGATAAYATFVAPGEKVTEYVPLAEAQCPAGKTMADAAEIEVTITVTKWK